MPGDLRTFAQHGVEGWYLGPPPEDYICYIVYVPDTRSKLLENTIKLFPHEFPIRGYSSIDAARRSIDYLAEEVKNHPRNLIFLLGTSNSG